MIGTTTTIPLICSMGTQPNNVKGTGTGTVAVSPIIPISESDSLEPSTSTMLTLVTSAEFQDLETKVSQLNQKLDGLSSWIFNQFGHQNNFPSDLKELFGFQLVEIEKIQAQPQSLNLNPLQNPKKRQRSRSRQQSQSSIVSPRPCPPNPDLDIDHSSLSSSPTPIKIIFQKQQQYQYEPMPIPNAPALVSPSPALALAPVSADCSTLEMEVLEVDRDPLAPDIAEEEQKEPQSVDDDEVEFVMMTVQNHNNNEFKTEQEKEAQLTDQQILAQFPQIKPCSVHLINLNIPPEYLTPSDVYADEADNDIKIDTSPIATPPQEFICEECGQSFTNPESKINHRRLHINVKKPFQCVTCSRRFSFSSALVQHQRAGNCENAPFPCEICGMRFAHLITKNLHYKTAHPNWHPHYNGNAATKSHFPVRNPNQNKTNTKTQDKAPSAHLILNNLGKFQKYINKNSQSQPSNSNAAYLVSNNAGNSGVHLTNNHNGNTATTGQSLTSPNNNSQMSRTVHLIPNTSNTGVTKVVQFVPKNGHTFSPPIPSSSRVHLPSAGIGNSSSENETKFDVLMPNIVPNSPVQSPENPSNFFHILPTQTQNNSIYTNVQHPIAADDSQSDHLITNTYTVNAEENHLVKCDICDKTYSSRASLANHQRIHTGEKPFKCHICDKAFTQLGQRNKHLITHSQEKPFHCEVCNRGFAQRIQMERHFAVHTGYKPFKCDICAKDFSWKERLKRHYEQIHPEYHQTAID